MHPDASWALGIEGERTFDNFHVLRAFESESAICAPERVAELAVGQFSQRPDPNLISVTRYTVPPREALELGHR